MHLIQNFKLYATCGYRCRKLSHVIVVCFKKGKCITLPKPSDNWLWISVSSTGKISDGWIREIFGHYQIVIEMHSMWFIWFSYKRCKSQVLCKLKILVRSQ